MMILRYICCSCGGRDDNDAEVHLKRHTVLDDR